MDLNRLVKDLEEIKGCIEDNHIEKAEDLLGFVIGEINIAAQQGLHSDDANAERTMSMSCPRCNRLVKVTVPFSHRG